MERIRTIYYHQFITIHRSHKITIKNFLPFQIYLFFRDDYESFELDVKKLIAQNETLSFNVHIFRVSLCLNKRVKVLFLSIALSLRLEDKERRNSHN